MSLTRYARALAGRCRSCRVGVAMVLAALLAGAAMARADLPAYLQHLVAASPAEAALYRLMRLPGLQVLYPRPPKEAAGQLTDLLASRKDAELYALRAKAEEQDLNFSAAEQDWKSFAASSPRAELELADFYQRRLQIPEALATLTRIAEEPSAASERFLPPTRQLSWRTYERLLTLEADQARPTAATYESLIRHYPGQRNAYQQSFLALTDAKRYADAESLLVRYRGVFADDRVFPVQAQALLAYRQGDLAGALAVYDHAFDPAWPAALTSAYSTLLTRTHQQRAFLAAAQARLAADPDDLNDFARIFLYYQQQGRPTLAQQTLDRFRYAKEMRPAAWTAADLQTLAQLTEAAGLWAEAARFSFALSATSGTLPGGEPAAQAGLASLIHILVAAPDQPLAVADGNLSQYRDIATLDAGPGYWNGILSLWLNGTSPATEYNAEATLARPYFARAKAAELLAGLDQRFPAAAERPALHAELLQAEAAYATADQLLSGGRAFLTMFPSSPDRVQIAGLMADADARKNDTVAEFALYDSLLAELAAKSEGQPLTGGKADEAKPAATAADAADGLDTTETAPAATATDPFHLTPDRPTQPSLPAAQAYTQILDRYLARLTALNQLPQALTLLRRELDRSPADPLLYERLAGFLQQNNLSAEQERVYTLALARFADNTYYDKLARLYLREKKHQAFADLTRKVTLTFSGTELDGWFAKVTPGAPIGPALAVQLNLYAQQRFPHDVVFTHNLAEAYITHPTSDAVAYEALLRGHWFESADLRDRFFELLSRTGKLDAELAQLTPQGEPDPAALREQAELLLWTSRFEQAAPLFSQLADLYPADPDLDDRAVSLFRSLAYNDATPASTARAVAIESNLLLAAPDSPERLATLGDLYAEATSTGGEDLARAAPYFERIAKLHPGSPAGLLTAATIFWDYFQFPEALAELQQARTLTHQPTLYGYESGAIEESGGDLPAAIQFYLGAALDGSKAAVPVESPAEEAGAEQVEDSRGGPARARLLALAERPDAAALVDQATATLLTSAPSAASVGLRADVLIAQGRLAALGPVLDHALSQAADPEQAAAIAAVAQSHAMPPVYEHALAREAELTPDPVERLQLRLKLARSLEDRQQIAAATQVMTMLYGQNSRVLGIVRATADFYLRTGQSAKAIATLLSAAQVATPDLADRFTLEAAVQANASGQTAQARTLALQLLVKSPYDARYLAAATETYARERDVAGLRSFSTAHLQAMQSSPLDRDTKRQDIALFRRSLIPALTRLGDFPAALDQYLALLSAYPEDAATARQATLYALGHSLQPQLINFLQATVKQSPQDARFAALLGQVDSTFGDLRGALAAYNAAIAVRKDRVDLYTARASLEMRLDQLDGAAADYQRLYTLSYHDPAWMVLLAELRARQLRPGEVVQALQTAYLSGGSQNGPAAADANFAVADHLQRWGLLAEARTYADRGVALAGPTLLTGAAPPTLVVSEPGSEGESDTEEASADGTLDEANAAAGALPAATSNAAIYARVLARQGHADQALMALLTARRAALAQTSSLLSVALAEFTGEAADKAAVTQDFTRTRQQAIETALISALSALGQTVQTFYTPEQKLQYAMLLDAQQRAAPLADARLWITAASTAGLLDRAAAYRKQALRNAADLAEYATLQRSRLQFTELAQTCEQFSARQPVDQRNQILAQAARAYRDAGDTASELRVERTLAQAADTSLQDRFFDLLLSHDPAALTGFAGGSDRNLADAAANFSLAHGSEAQALAAVAAIARPALWHNANLALTGLYFATPGNAETPRIDAAFGAILLPDDTIAARLGHPADPGRQLTGDVWFAYAASYGVFRLKSPLPAKDAEDVLAAALELHPDQEDPYLELARTYAEAGQTNAALAEYAHALELNPDEPVYLNNEALLLEQSGHAAEALATWRHALATLNTTAQQAPIAELFYSEFTSLAQSVPRDRLDAELTSVLRTALITNGAYRSEDLVSAAYQTAPSEAAGLKLMLAATAGTPQEPAILAQLTSGSRLPDSVQRVLLRRRTALTPELAEIRVALVKLDLRMNDLTEAQTVLSTLPADQGTELRIELATRTSRLGPLVSAWRDDAASSPADEILAQVLTRLRTRTADYTPVPAQYRVLQEFAFERKRVSDTLTPTDYLALAETRLATADLPGALDLLHQLALLAADSEANTDSAARLLESTHHLAEAAPFLNTLTRLAPWDATFRLRLAQTSPATSQPLFTALAMDAHAAYAVRTVAARALITPQQTLGSAELNLLTTAVTAAAASQPYFAAARLAVMPTSPDMVYQAVAIAPLNPNALLSLLKEELEAGHTAQALAIRDQLSPAGERTLPQAAGSMLPSTQAHLAQLLAAAELEQRNPAAAIAYLTQAESLEPSPATEHRMVEINQQMWLDQQNTQRRPLIQTTLAQANQVRPRLNALALEAQ